MQTTNPLVIAFYLPQFHPIPENDRFWGKGFTEWTNTTRAKPLYEGHYQPHHPTELGFYDLRVPEIRQAQAELAREHGVTAFAYWHYWFGNGRRVLERPFDEVLKSGKPDFPFCLSWANDSWTGVWHGAPGRTLIEQTYPGRKDIEAHFRAVLPAFNDPRYVKIQGKPLFGLHLPDTFPRLREFSDLWNELAVQEGFGGIYFVATTGDANWDNRQHGMDAKTLHTPTAFSQRYLRKQGIANFDHIGPPDRKLPAIFDYADVVAAYDFNELNVPDIVPTVLPNWDNTPRSGNRGIVFANSTPELFGRHFEAAYRFVVSRPELPQLVLVKSWNEWAEGNYLEPDLQWGRGYLEAMQKVLASQSARKFQ